MHDASAPAVAGSAVSGGGGSNNAAAISGKVATAGAGGGMMAQLGENCLDRDIVYDSIF